MNPTNQPATIDARHRILMTLWFALFTSIGLFFLLTLLTTRNDSITPNNTVTLALLLVAVTAVIASYLIKQRFLAQAIAKQDMLLVQQGLIVAAAINEVAAMLGLLDYFLTANRYYYVFFIMAAIGALLNFPRRDHLLAASYKKDLN